VLASIEHEVAVLPTGLHCLMTFRFPLSLNKDSVNQNTIIEATGPELEKFASCAILVCF
jgi:hypothetical protein